MLRISTIRRLTIKGRPSDEAVLCTSSKTYAIRSVQISNELVLFAPTTSAGSLVGEKRGLEVKDTLHELLELSECVPRTGRIEGVLKGQEWEGLEGEEREEEEEGQRPVSFSGPLEEVGVILFRQLSTIWSAL